MAMITIKIKGQPVKVDEKFKTLSPADQQKTVNEIAAQMGLVSAPQRTEEPPAPPKPEEQGSGVLENIAAAGNEAIIGTLAAPGQLLYGGYNYLTQPKKELGLSDLITGNQAPAKEETRIPSIIPGPADVVDALKGSLSFLNLPAAPTAEETKKQWEGTFAQAGITPPSEVKATTPAEKIARLGTEGVLWTVAPELIAGKLAQLGIVGPRSAEVLQTVFGKGEKGTDILKSAIVGGGATAGGGMAAEAAPDEWKPTVALLASIAAGGATAGLVGLPGATVAGVKKIGEYLDPAIRGQAGVEREAGRQIIQSAQDVDNLIATLKMPTEPTVSGVKPTLAEMTGDVGLAAAEKKAAQLRPDEYEARRVQVGAAREQALRNIQQTGDASEVIPAVRGYLERVDAMKTDIETAALNNISSLTDDLTRGAIDPETAGERIRASLEASRKAARQAEGALHEAVDPDGKLRTSIEGIKQRVSELRDEVKGLGVRPDAEEQALYRDITRAPEVAPYSEAIKFQRRVNGMMRDERYRNGETERWRRLSELNKAAHAELENAVLVQIKREANAVSAGRLAPEDTLYAKLSSLSDELARQQIEAGGNAGARAAQAPGAYEATFGGANAPVGRGERGLGGLEGGEGLPPPAGRTPDELARQAVEAPLARPTAPEAPPYTPPVERGVSVEVIEDPEAMLRLRAAKDATIERVRTFDNQYLAPLRRMAPTGQEYKVATEKVAGNIFGSQIDASARIDALRAAIGKEEADNVLTSYALDRVAKEAVREGIADPKALARWRAKNSDALKALPELDAKLQDTTRLVDEIATRSKDQIKALDNEQKAAVGPFLERSTGQTVGNDPKAVDQAIGSILTGKNAVDKLKALRRAIGDDPVAAEGLKKAVVDHITSKFVKVTQGPLGDVRTLDAEPLLNFVRANEDALLAAGMSRAQINSIKAIATEAAQSSALLRAAVSTRKPATLGDVTKKVLSGQPQSILNRITLRQALVKGGLFGGSLISGFGHVQLIGDFILTMLRNSGMEQVDDLVARAMLDPDLARTLVQKVTPKNERVVTRRLREILARGVGVGTAIGMTKEAEVNP